MKTLSRTTQRLGLLAAVTAASVVVIFRTSGLATPRSAAMTATPASLSFNEQGELLRPEGYRRWISVGTPLTPNDMNGGQAAFPEFHAVYIHPDAFDAYERTGRFPDGTVLVKELLSVGTKQASSGKGYFMGDFTGLEVLIKDANRFKDQPGNWAFFSFGHEYPLKDSARLQPVENCSTCHGAAADDDYVFTQYYPVLRAAKATASVE